MTTSRNDLHPDVTAYELVHVHGVLRKIHELLQLPLPPAAAVALTTARTVMEAALGEEARYVTTPRPGTLLVRIRDVTGVEVLRRHIVKKVSTTGGGGPCVTLLGVTGHFSLSTGLGSVGRAAVDPDELRAMRQRLSVLEYKPRGALK